jgi:hypothetical protein
MPEIRLQDGKPILREGKVGAAAPCCCGQPCNCVLKTSWVFNICNTYGDMNQSTIDAAYRVHDRFRQNLVDAGWTVTFFGENFESLLYPDGLPNNCGEATPLHFWFEIHAECCAAGRTWGCVPSRYTSINDMTGTDGDWIDDDGNQQTSVAFLPVVMPITQGTRSGDVCGWAFAHTRDGGNYSRSFFPEYWPICADSCRVAIVAWRHVCDSDADTEEGDAEAQAECESLANDWLPAIQAAFTGAGWIAWQSTQDGMGYITTPGLLDGFLEEQCPHYVSPIGDVDCGEPPAGLYYCNTYISAECEMCDPENADTEPLTGDASGTTITLTYLDGPNAGQTYEFPADTIPVCNPLP